MSSFFEIETARDLFNVLDSKFNKYCERQQKDAEDILLVLLITNHLREWIAPEYGPKHDRSWPLAVTPEEEFSRKIFEHPNFATIRKLCNGSKHASKGPETDIKYNAYMSTWSNVSAVKHMSKGVPVTHFVDGESIEDVAEPLIEMYRGWFSDSKH